MTSEEYYKIMHLMDHAALHDINTGRLDGKCEDVIPLEDATAIIDSVYKTETVTESEEAKDTITVLQTLREDVIKYRDNKANDFNFLIGLIFEIAAINGVIHIIDKLIAEIKNK